MAQDLGNSVMRKPLEYKISERGGLLFYFKDLQRTSGNLLSIDRLQLRLLDATGKVHEIEATSCSSQRTNLQVNRQNTLVQYVMQNCLVHAPSNLRAHPHDMVPPLRDVMNGALLPELLGIHRLFTFQHYNSRI